MHIPITLLLTSVFYTSPNAYYYNRGCDPFEQHQRELRAEIDRHESDVRGQQAQTMQRNEQENYYARQQEAELRQRADEGMMRSDARREDAVAQAAYEAAGREAQVHTDGSSDWAWSQERAYHEQLRREGGYSATPCAMPSSSAPTNANLDQTALIKAVQDAQRIVDGMDRHPPTDEDSEAAHWLRAFVAGALGMAVMLVAVGAGFLFGRVRG